jgi:hypothetical protein
MVTPRITDTPRADLLRGGAIGAENQRLLSAAQARPVAPNVTPSVTRPATLSLAPDYQKPAVNTATGQYARPAAAPVPGAAPSTPNMTNATATGGQKPMSFQAGQNTTKALVPKGSSLRPTLAAGTLAGIATESAVDSFSRPTEDYFRRLGMDPNQAGTSLLRDMGVRAAGVTTDLGASILDAPVNAANSVSRMFGGEGNLKLPGGSFAELTQRFDKPAAETATNPAAPSGGKPKLPPNFRGNNFDDPRRVDLDPSRATLGPSRDFSNELASVPANLPADLRQGVIYETTDANGRKVFSGRNVGANAQTVDGKGATLRQGGGVSTVPGMSKEQIAEIMGRPTPGGAPFNPNMTAAQNLQYNREVQEAEMRNNAGRIIENSARGGLRGGAAGGTAGGPSGVDALRKFAGRDDVALGTLQALTSAETDARTQDVNLRGQDIDRAVDTRGQDIDMRGQDMRLEGQLLPKQMELAQAQRLREMNAAIFKEAGGDAMAAAGLAASMGADPSSFLEMASRGQTIDFNAGKNAETALEQFMRPDGDGKITDGERARVRGLANSVVPGYATMNERQRREAQPMVNGALNLINGFNDRRNTSWLQAMGIDRDNPDLTSIPDFGEGAKLQDVGIVEGGLTAGAQRNDYAILMKNGQKLYIPSGNMNQETLEFLKSKGVDIGDRK